MLYCGDVTVGSITVVIRQYNATKNLHFHAIFAMPIIGQNLHNYLTLQGHVTSTVSGHVSDVTIPPDRG